jgi:hypothetical protein
MYEYFQSFYAMNKCNFSNSEGNRYDFYVDLINYIVHLKHLPRGKQCNGLAFFQESGARLKTVRLEQKFISIQSFEYLF